MKTMTLISLICLLTVGVAGCNTTRGLGQDIQAAGGFLEEAAEDAQDDSDHDE